MKLLSAVQYSCASAQAAFDRAQFLFEVADEANKRGFPELLDVFGSEAIKQFNRSKDLERLSRNSRTLASALR